MPTVFKVNYFVDFWVLKCFILIMKKQKYKILKCEETSDLEVEVEAHIDMGYELHGGPFTTYRYVYTLTKPMEKKHIINQAVTYLPTPKKWEAGPL